MWRVVVLIGVGLVALTACSALPWTRNPDDEYLREFASWYRDFETHRYTYETDEYERVVDQLAKIQPPARYRTEHEWLVNAHVMMLNVDKHLALLEPIEQAHWRRQGTDDVAACIILQVDRFLSMYASSDFLFTCRTRNLAVNNLARVEAVWEVSILHVYGADPYHVRR